MDFAQLYALIIIIGIVGGAIAAYLVRKYGGQKDGED